MIDLLKNLNASVHCSIQIISMLLSSSLCSSCSTGAIIVRCKIISVLLSSSLCSISQLSSLCLSSRLCSSCRTSSVIVRCKIISVLLSSSLCSRDITRPILALTACYLKLTIYYRNTLYKIITLSNTCRIKTINCSANHVSNTAALYTTKCINLATQCVNLLNKT